jgi:hypothetical protein
MKWKATWPILRHIHAFLGTGENHEALNEDGSCRGRDSNQWQISSQLAHPLTHTRRWFNKIYSRNIENYIWNWNRLGDGVAQSVE